MKTAQLLTMAALLTTAICAAEVKRTSTKASTRPDRFCAGKREFAPCKSSEHGTESQCVKGAQGKLECRRAGEFCNPSESRWLKKHFKKGRFSKDEKGHLICKVAHKHHPQSKKPFGSR